MRNSTSPGSNRRRAGVRRHVVRIAHKDFRIVAGSRFKHTPKILSDNILDVEERPTSFDGDTVADIRLGVTRLAHRLRAERPAGALSVNKTSVLGHLYRHGPSTPKEIAVADFQPPQALTRVFAELEAGGLITRARSDSDGRASLLTLTQKGREALSHDMDQRDRWLGEALAELTVTEVELLRVAARLMDRMAATGTSDERTADGGAKPREPSTATTAPDFASNSK